MATYTIFEEEKQKDIDKKWNAIRSLSYLQIDIFNVTLKIIIWC